MIKAVLFDMDGVITNTEYLHFLSWQKAFLDVGYTIDYDKYVATLQSRNREIGISNIIDSPSEEVLENISYLKTHYYEQLISQNIEVYDDAVTLIKQLYKMDIKLAVVSASSYAKKVINRIGLSKYFDIIVSGTRNVEMRNKPFPDIYLYTMSKLDILSNEAVIIEDSISGINAGIASGAKVIGVCREQINIQGDESLSLVGKLDISDIFF